MILKALGWSLLLLFILGTVGSIMTFIPDIENPSVPGLVTVWILSLLIAASGFLNRLKPSLMASYMVLFNISNLIMAAAIHGLGTFLPGWIWSVPLLSAYLLAWSLPFLSPRLARTISNEQLEPKTRFGKNFLVIVLCLAGISGVVGGLFGLLSNRLLGSRTPAMLFIGILGAFLAIGCGQTFSYQLWEKRQKQIQARMNRAG